MQHFPLPQGPLPQGWGSGTSLRSGELLLPECDRYGALGFFLPDDESGKEYFIPPHGVGNAIDGDRVQAKIYYPDSAGNVLGYPSKGPVAYIINILERKRVFTVANMTSRHTAAPLDRHLPDELPVNSVPRGVKTGDWVKLRLLANGKKFTERLRGSVEENLGRAGTVRGDLNAVMAEFKLEGPYTEAEEKAASALTMEKIARTDLRHQIFFSRLRRDWIVPPCAALTNGVCIGAAAAGEGETLPPFLAS